jgi:hypothetical protein
MTDLSKSMHADDNQVLRLAIAMLHFPSIFITKKHLRSLGFSLPERMDGNELTKGHRTPSVIVPPFFSHKERAYALETVFYSRQINGRPPG